MPHVLLVTKEGCKPCSRVKRILAEFRNEIPSLTVEEIDFSSQRGMELAIQHNILYPPAVYVDGQFLAYGKIYEEPLRDAVRARAAPRSG